MKNKYLVYMMAFLGLGLADLFYLNSQIIPSLWPEKNSMNELVSMQGSDPLTSNDTVTERSNRTKIDDTATGESDSTLAKMPDETRNFSGTQNQATTANQLSSEKNSNNQIPAAGNLEDAVDTNENMELTTGDPQNFDKTPGVRSFKSGRTSLTNTPSEPSLITDIVVRFEVSQFKLPSKYIRKLNSELAKLDLAKNLRVVVDGYADQTGADEIDNDMLSQKRADYVATLLIQQGFSKECMTVKGHGDSNPIDENSTIEAWAKNRRVEIKIFKDES